MEVISKFLIRHSPLRRKRLRDDPVPWITPHIKQLMRRRDFHKKQAVKHNSKLQWELYKVERNKLNIQSASKVKTFL